MLRKIIVLFLCFALFGCTEQREPERKLKKADLPELYSEYVYIYDYVNDQVLYDCKAEERMYPASMTKMMTAIVAIESVRDLEDTFTFTPEVLEGLEEAHANRAGFAPGDAPTIYDLICGDLLSSGADCSRGLAWYISGSEEAYVDRMNRKAEELGMTGTHFVNTSGLFDPDHYTTCKDMGILLEYCLQNETFTEIITTLNHLSIPVDAYPRGLGMTNLVMIYINQDPPKMKYNFTIPGFISGKAGYTETSRFTLASYGAMNGMHVLMITGGAFVEEGYPANMADAEKLYPWVFSRFQRKVPVHAGDLYTIERVRWCEGDSLKVRADNDLVGDIAGMTQVTVLPDVINGPVQAGDKLGEIEIYAYEELVGKVDLLSTESRGISFRGILLTLGYELSHDYLWVVGAVLLLIVLLMVFLIWQPRRRLRLYIHRHQ